jgi:hypothetical protein
LHGADRAAAQFALQQPEKLAAAAAELWKLTDSKDLKRDAEIARKVYNREVYVIEFPYNERRPSHAAPAPKAR